MRSDRIKPSLLIIIFMHSILFLNCTERDREFADFAGFWVTENGANFIYINDEYALDSFSLGCSNPLVNENGVFYLLDTCVNSANHFEYTNHKNKYRIELNKKNQLLIFYDNSNPDIPWIFEQLEIKVCEPQIVSLRISIVLDSNLYYKNQINIDLAKDEVWINGILTENTKSISWLKTYCYDEISTKRTDINFPPAPIGVKPINIEMIFNDGRNELIILDGLISAPLEVQALVLFLVSFLVY